MSEDKHAVIYLVAHGQVESCSMVASWDNLYCRFQFSHGPEWKYMHGNPTGLTQIARRDPTNPEEQFVWGYPIEATFQGQTLAGWPRITVYVHSISWWAGDQPRGCGWAHVPARPGRHEISIPLYAPCQPSVCERMLGYLTLSKEKEFWDARFINSGKNRELTRVKHVGYLALTLNVMTRNMDVMGHVLDSADRETVRARREAARRQIQEVMESIKPQLSISKSVSALIRESAPNSPRTPRTTQHLTGTAARIFASMTARRSQVGSLASSRRNSLTERDKERKSSITTTPRVTIASPSPSISGPAGSASFSSPAPISLPASSASSAIPPLTVPAAASASPSVIPAPASPLPRLPSTPISPVYTPLLSPLPSVFAVSNSSTSALPSPDRNAANRLPSMSLYSPASSSAAVQDTRPTPGQLPMRFRKSTFSSQRLSRLEKQPATRRSLSMRDREKEREKEREEREKEKSQLLREEDDEDERLFSAGSGFERSSSVFDSPRQSQWEQRQAILHSRATAGARVGGGLVESVDSTAAISSEMQTQPREVPSSPTNRLRRKRVTDL